MSRQPADGWNSFDTEPPGSVSFLVYIETADRDHYWIALGKWEPETKRLMTPPATGNEKSRALFWRLYPEPPSERRSASAWKKPAVTRISSWQKEQEADDGSGWGAVIKHPSPELLGRYKETFDPSLSFDEQKAVWSGLKDP